MQYIIKHITTIIATYSGHPPLAIWLKQYYKQQPKLGSRDRRAITAAVYLYYRAAYFYTKESPALSIIREEVNEDSPAFLLQVLQHYQLQQSFDAREDAQNLWPVKLSEGIKLSDWLQSMRQPARLFIRLRAEVAVALRKLEQEKVMMQPITLPGNSSSICLSLPNGTAIDQLLPEESYVVQDASSQKSVSLLLQWLADINAIVPKKIWDVCSGAGGKSIFLKDHLDAFDLLASDVRTTILHNLRQRFLRYGLTAFRTQVLDMTRKVSVDKALQGAAFDWVVCDVPCSGSGTWSRTPEQFHFFDAEQVVDFQRVQKQITMHAWPFVQEGGYLAYITCSVFEMENEQIVAEILQQPGALLIQQQLINGIDIQADSMFVALIKKTANSGLPDH